MTDLEQAIQVLEGSSLTATTPQGRQPRKFDLHKRMADHKVPGFSIAFIEQGELAWARGYGEMEAGIINMVSDGSRASRSWTLISSRWSRSPTARHITVRAKKDTE